MNIPDFNDIKIKNYIPQKIQLTNGIPVYCFENKDMDVVFVKIVFKNAGTVYQDKYFTASLTKTQLAQDTKDYSALSLADAMDYYGVNFSSSTSNERTVLNFSFLKQYQTEVLRLIEQILLYPLFNQDKLDITINNSKQEFLTKCRQTSFLAHREFMANLFGRENPYGRYASFEDYDKVKSEDLKLFYSKRYTFNQCYIIVAGNTDNVFYNQLGDILGKNNWNADTADTSSGGIAVNLNPKAETTVVNLDSAVQASVCMGKFFPDIHHKDYIPLTVLNCLFGGYFNSRLMSNIREDKGYTYGIDSFIAPFSKGSVFMIVTDVTAGMDGRTLEEIFKEIRILQTQKVSKEELDTVKHYMMGEMLRSNDGVSEIADSYDQFVRFGLADDYNGKSMDIVKNITADDIIRLAETYLNTDSFIISTAKNTK
ncbi:MAG: insulinase family protein [Bacteroidales bacterium]|nr:insulinase family protein [Bacteroidales bacterium]